MATGDRRIRHFVVLLSIAGSVLAVSPAEVAAAGLPPELSVDVSNTSFREDIDPAITPLVITVGADHGRISVSRVLREDDAAENPARIGDDFEWGEVSDVLRSGQHTVGLGMPLIDDDVPEPDETIFLDVVVHAVTPEGTQAELLARETFGLTVIDDDPPGSYLNSKRLLPFEVTANGSYQALAGDFDCTVEGGWPGILWYAPGSASDHLWTELTFDDSRPGVPAVVPVSSRVNVSGDYRPIVGDFDGNGCSDVFWYAPGPRPDYLWYFTPAGIESVRRDVTGVYQPIVLANGEAIYWWNPVGRDFFWIANGRSFQRVSDVIQLNGLFYYPIPMFNADLEEYTIVWYIPGGGPPDLTWTFTANGVVAAATNDGGDLDDFHRPLPFFARALLYAPGRASERTIIPVGLDGIETRSDYDVNGTYRTSSLGHALWEMAVWHAPGTAKDFLWLNAAYFDDGWYDLSTERGAVPGDGTEGGAPADRVDRSVAFTLTPEMLRPA